MLPIATYVMVTAPLGARMASAMRSGAAVYDTRFAVDYYRPLADTRLLVEGSFQRAKRGGPAGRFTAQLTYWYYALRDRLRE